jgi:hypothetical protein
MKFRRTRRSVAGWSLVVAGAISAACAAGGSFLHDDDPARQESEAAAPNEATVETAASPEAAPAADSRAAPTCGDAALDAAFAPSAAILAGFDAVEPGAAWRPGDAILFGVSFKEGARHSTRFVRYVVVGALQSETTKAAEPELPAASAETPSDSKARGAAALPTVDAPRRHGRLTRFLGKKRIAEVSEPSIALLSTVYDADGREIKEEPISLPVAALTTSFPAAIEAFAAALGDRGLKVGFENHKTPEGRRREMRLEPKSRGASEGVSAEVGTAAGDASLALGYAMFGLVDSFRHNSALRDFRRRVADVVCETPSIFGAVFSGVEGELTVDASSSRSPKAEDRLFAPTPASGLGARVAFDALFRINGDEAMKMRFIVGPPEPPFHLSSGVVGFDARHPEHDDRSIVVRVLAARRG